MVLDPNLLFASLAAPLVGSFLGLLIVRLPAGEAVVLSRSRCDHCGHVLSARDLVPLLSWLASRARCRFCSARLSALYPGIELLALLVVAWAGTALSGWLLWAGCALGWSLLALAAIDHRAMILPDGLTLPLIPAGLAVAWLLDPPALPGHLVGAALGYGAFWLAREGYWILRRREGLGLGDAKLMAAAGAWLSWPSLPSVVLIAALAGLLVAIARTFDSGPGPAGERIAFGPCICLAIWLVWLYGPIELG